MLGGFGKLGRNTQYYATPGFSFDTHGNKYSTITYDVISSHFGISCIEEKMGVKGVCEFLTCGTSRVILRRKG